MLLKQFNAASASAAAAAAAASKDKLMTLGPWRDAIVRSVNAYPVGLSPPQSLSPSFCPSICLAGATIYGPKAWPARKLLGICR